MEIKYSIIIPTYNRAKILQKCLKHISELENPIEDWEVLVINNNSNDETEDIVKSFIGKIPQLRYFHTKSPGLHIGRNLGCEKARGEILCYIDDDSFVSKGWLKGIEQAFSNPEVILVGGPCLPEYEIQPPDCIKFFWNFSKYGKSLASLSLIDFGIQVKIISANFVFGCNFCIRKSILLELGGFHPDSMPQNLIRFRGDGESFVSMKIMDMDGLVLYFPDVKVRHFVPATRLTVDYFCKRAYNQGISKSFTKIRKEHGLYGELPERISNLRKAARIIRRPLGTVRRFLFTGEPRKIVKIKREIRKSSEKGFAYHQAEVKKDPKLLEWVLRENYLGKNGELPLEHGSNI